MATRMAERDTSLRPGGDSSIDIWNLGFESVKSFGTTSVMGSYKIRQLSLLNCIPESGDRKSETLVTTTLSAIMSDPTICLLVTFRFKMNWNFERF